MRLVGIAHNPGSMFKFAAAVPLAIVLCLVGAPSDFALAQGQAAQLSSAASARAGQAQPDEYVVKQGDSLLGIAQSHNTTVDELVQVNGLANPNSLSLGQVLRLPRTESEVPAPTAPAPEETSEVESPPPADVAASTKIDAPEAPTANSAAEPAVGAPSVFTAPFGSEPAAANLPASANLPVNPNQPVSANPPLAANSAPSAVPLPSVPELIALVLLLVLTSWGLIEMRRARPRVRSRGPPNSGSDS